MIAFLFNHLWQSTVFAGGIGFLALLFQQNSARVRFGLWFAASLKFLIPFSLLASLGAALTPEQLNTRAASLIMQAQPAAEPFTGLTSHFDNSSVNSSNIGQLQPATARQPQTFSPLSIWPQLSSGLIEDRPYIAALENGSPDYDAMTPAMAELTRLDLAGTRAQLRTWGKLKALKFRAVSPDGLNVYDAVFEHDHGVWQIAPLTNDGKVQWLIYDAV